MPAAKRVLIVDDERDILETLRLILIDEGYEVLTAPDGAAALDLIARQGDPNLILLDAFMPRMDGWQFLSEYRRRPGSRAPVVLVSATRNPPTDARLRADDWLGKPFEIDDLLELVQRHAR